VKSRHTGDLPKAHAVLVVGMHRSGTSAVASALGSLGLVLPRSDDLLGPRRGNDRGHFESLSLMDQSDELLRLLGGSWDDPPPIPPDPVSSDELGPVAPRAAATFRRAFDDPDRAVCWKDPRTALLLPFWRQVIDRPLAAVLCVRHPLEVARSLERRNSLELPVSLALWERYQHRAVAGLFGLPVYVMAFAHTLEEPQAWLDGVHGWLASLGIRGLVSEASAPLCSSLGFDPTLRHERMEHGEQTEIGRPETADDLPSHAFVLETQQQLYEELLGLCGAHDAFEHHLATAESPWTAHLLDQRRDASRLWRAADWLADELASNLVANPVPAFDGIGQTGRATATEEPPSTPSYPLNAAEDLNRYTAWLTERGESARTANDRAADVARGSRTLTRATRGIQRRERTLERAGVRHPEDLPSPAPGGSKPPLFSVIVPCFRTPLDLLDRCVASVLAQHHSDWEMWLCDDASGDERLAEGLAELSALDRRIATIARSSNGGISAATNDALALASGKYVVFLDHDDELHPSALERVARAIADRPDADLIYSDEDKIDLEGHRHTPSFKPDWSPDLLLSNAYMCHLLVVRRDLLTELGGLRSEFDGAQDYDLMLRATEVTGAIVHVPEILYHWRTAMGSASGDPSAKPWAFEAGRRALEDAAARRGIDATVVNHPRVAGSYHFMRTPLSGYLVSAVIPFRDEPALTAACYRSFIQQPGYDNFELLLVDNDSALPETQALLEDLARDHRVRLVPAPGTFDWAAINNEAARKARGELLLFLNNDIEAQSEGWLAAMVAQAERSAVGAVGARLLFPDGTVQHAGVAVGVGWAATHIQQGLEPDHPGYLSVTTVTRNTSAVTGACMMTRRSVFEELGGFDPNLPIAFNDIDYCLRLREKGLLVIYTPLAEMIHHESKSRGHSDDTGETPFFRNRWRSLMLSGDPYYNCNLGRFDNNCRLPSEEDEEKWEIFLSMLSESSTN
jgi:O-antigen biosynthesis protein